LVSSAILLTAWLDLPLAVLIDKLFPTGAAKPAEWKFMVVEVVLLVYLGIRYRLSGEGSQYLNSERDELDVIRNHRTLVFLQSNADLFTKSGIEHPVFQKEVSAYLAADGGRKSKCNLYGRPKILIQFVNRSNGSWKPVIGLTLTWFLENGVWQGSENGATIKVAIAGINRLFIECRARLHFWTYSEMTIKYLVPVLLGLCATISMFGRVTMAYVNS
jgi:hypothetical protein